MEVYILYLDSKACHLTLYQYAIVCLNARLSWIPFAELYSRRFKDSKTSKKKCTVIVIEQ